MTKPVVGFLAIAILVLVGTGLLYGLRSLIQLFADLDPQVAKVTGIACGTVLLCALILASSVRTNRGRDPSLRVEMQKAELYLDLIETWSKALSNHRPGDSAAYDTLGSDLGPLEKRLILLGNAGVLKHYMSWRACSGRPHADDIEAHRHVVQAILEMRKELGRQNLGIGETKLLELLMSSC